MNVGEGPAEGRGLSDQVTVHDTVVCLVGVAGNDRRDFRVQLLGDIDDRSGKAGAAVIGTGARLRPALVDEKHDRVHASLLELGGGGVRRSHLVIETQALDALGGDDGRGVLQGHSDEPDRYALEPPYRPRLEQRPVPVYVDDVGREVFEIRAAEPPELAVVHRVAAAALQPAQFVLALVELVVPDAADVDAHLVEDVDRRLVVKESRNQRAGADIVTGGDGDGVGVTFPKLLQPGREIDGATRVHATDPPAATGRRTQIAVEVVEPEYLYLDLGAAAPLVRLRSRRRHHEG